MGNYSVEKTVFDGQEALVLSDHASGLSGILLPGFGSNLIGLRLAEPEVKLLYEPDSMADLHKKAVGWGFPVLMPPNRIEGGRFSFEGREYKFEINENGVHHIHGLVHSLPWRVVAVDTESAASVTTAIRSDDHPSILASYPHSFELRMIFTLKGNRIDITFEAENFGAETMPFGVGFHPYFNVPLTSASSKGKCTVQVPANKRWELREDCIPTGRRLDLSGTVDLRSPQALDSVMLDDVYTDLEYENGESVCSFVDQGSGISLRYGADSQFKHWVVFTGKTPDAPFVCLEPYTWTTNAPNLDLPAQDTGLIALEGGKTFTGVTWLEVAR